MSLSSGPEDYNSSQQHPGVCGQHSSASLCGVRRQCQHRLVQVKVSIGTKMLLLLLMLIVRIQD